jgi:hypothetical protein
MKLGGTGMGIGGATTTAVRRGTVAGVVAKWTTRG